VLLLACILLVALLMGWGLGGALRNLAHLQVGLWWIYPVALALQIIPVPHSESGTGRYLPFAVLLFSYLALIGVTAVNWRLRGFAAILLGLVLNLVPIAVNRGMPVSGRAVQEAGGSIRDVPRGEGQKHHLETPEDQVTFLADVLPVRAPFRQVVSVGDLVMYLGAGYFFAAAMLATPERRPRRVAERRRRPQPSTTWESPP
jgi:uncharacterized protein DUF5317